ncbi:MAG: glycosyl hydrolase family 28 protein [Anaerocolumna sp.]
MKKIFYPEDYGAVADGKTLTTRYIQTAIDNAGEINGRVVLKKGIYLTGSLFLKSNLEFIIEEEAELRGTNEEGQYPIIPSRIAGIEMTWPAGLLNIIKEKNVILMGKGTVNGEGKFWWDKYWNMRKEYEEKNLRWAVDYDCFRPRNLVVYQGENIQLKEFRCIQSGFWNVHICYSKDVLVEGIEIQKNQGPSTDGIDIDSSHHVIVRGCSIDCNDDNICVKAGRDWDGLRVNEPCDDVLIENCRIGSGAGITLGSETSGGIHNITIRNIKFEDTMCGFRIKSARTRGGLIEDINVEALTMENVATPFSFLLDWNPSYSYCSIPSDYNRNIPEYWETLSKAVSKEDGMPVVRNISIKEVTAFADKENSRSKMAFEIEGFEEQPIENIKFENIGIEAVEPGSIKHVKNLQMKDVTVTIE